MIIGNNNFKNFGRKINPTDNSISKLNLNTEESKYKDVNNTNEMYEKSMIMLQERFKKGLISYEEFTKQCEKLNKLRRK